MKNDLKPYNLDFEATKLSDQLPELRKPLIIEICGTPKAGKTLSIDAIIKWAHRNGIPAYKITERASLCPLEDKKSPFFNLWTGCSIIDALLESLEKTKRIIIFDRGIFDTLIWMNIYHNRGQLSDYEFSKIENFLLLDKFIKDIQVVVTLTTDPKESIRREFKNQITTRPGSIMNEAFLNEYNETLRFCIEKYKDKFKKIINIDTTKLEPHIGVGKIANLAINTANELIDEEIAVIPRSVLFEFGSNPRITYQREAIIDAMINICKNVKWLPRSKAEESSDFVQLIPVAMFCQKNQYLVITNRGYRHHRMAEHIAIWAGGHTRVSDYNGIFSIDFLRSTLNRELNEELQIPNILDLLPKYPEAIVWDNTNTKSSRHLGIFYKIDAKKLSTKLDKREFHEAASKSIFSEYISVDKLKDMSGWESWSKIYLHAFHDIEFQDEDSQLQLL